MGVEGGRDEGEHGQETGQFKVGDICRLWMLLGGAVKTNQMCCEPLPMGLILLPTRDQQGEIW